jgi:hypothetical protein
MSVLDHHQDIVYSSVLEIIFEGGTAIFLRILRLQGHAEHRAIRADAYLQIRDKTAL